MGVLSASLLGILNEILQSGIKKRIQKFFFCSIFLGIGVARVGGSRGPKPPPMERFSSFSMGF